MISAMSLIYNIFKISISEREKNIAALSSIGASKYQIFKIYFIEVCIITVIGLLIGFLISFGINFMLINILNNLFKTMRIDILTGSLVKDASTNVDLHLVICLSSMIISIILVIITIILSVCIPIMNISKTTIIERLRKNKFNKINKKIVKTPKIIRKVFKASGDLAYKNVRRSRSKYITMVISLTISIVMFMSVSGYISNLNSYNKLDILDYNYSFYAYSFGNEKDYSNDVIETLNQLDLIDDIYGLHLFNTLFHIVQNNNINSSLKISLNKIERLRKGLDLEEDGSIEIPAEILLFDDNTYNNYLAEIGENIKLNKGECILVNYYDSKTKYFDGLYLTNYEIGDKITLNTKERNNELDEIMNQLANLLGGKVDNENRESELTIKAVSNVIPKWARRNIDHCSIYLIVNVETFEEMYQKLFKISPGDRLHYYIKSRNPNAIDGVIEELNKNYDRGTRIYGENYMLAQQLMYNEKNIKEILLYSFLILVSILSIINVFNVIISNMKLRKNEIAELRAIGMSKEQLNKMFILEGIFYGISSVILGGMISLAILYTLYKNMIDIELYAFSFPWINFVIAIIAVYMVIFIGIGYAKGQIKKENISELIKGKI